MLLTVLALLVGLSLSGCMRQDELVLDGVEVQEYQGERLDSITEFRENSIKGPQYIDNASYSLRVTGLVEDPLNYSYDDVLQTFPQYTKVVTLHCVEGWSVHILWEGIRVTDIIERSTPLDAANTIIFHAYDGYTTSLPLEYVHENDILLAFKMNNVTLPPQRGWPFQLVAESKWGYKWIKWVTDIEVTDESDYEGYWESRGYSNNADLDKGFFEE